MHLPDCCAGFAVARLEDLELHHRCCRRVRSDDDVEELVNAHAPPVDAMEAFLGQDREGFLDGWTIRRCLECNTPVAGGPTRCTRCGHPARGALRELLTALEALGEVPGSVKAAMVAAQKAL